MIKHPFFMVRGCDACRGTMFRRVDVHHYACMECGTRHDIRATERRSVQRIAVPVCPRCGLVRRKMFWSHGQQVCGVCDLALAMAEEVAA